MFFGVERGGKAIRLKKQFRRRRGLEAVGLLPQEHSDYLDFSDVEVVIDGLH